MGKKFRVECDTTYVSTLEFYDNSEGETRVMLQTDYFHPLGEAGSFELGSRFTLREIFNNYLVQDSDDGQLYTDNANLSNDFNYDENIYAFYGLFNNEFSFSRRNVFFEEGETNFDISDKSSNPSKSFRPKTSIISINS